MAQVELPSPLGLMRGKLNQHSDIVFYVRNGKQYCRKAPEKRDLKLSPFTEKELKVQNDFKAARQYVAEVMADPTRKKHYEKRWKQNMRHYPTLRGFILHCYYEEYLHE